MVKVYKIQILIKVPVSDAGENRKELRFYLFLFGMEMPPVAISF